MERLPQEIHDSIATFVWWLERQDRQSPRIRLSRLAPLSRRWRSAIERQTFLILKISSNDLVDFAKLVQGSRRRYLRTLWFEVILPDYQDAKDRFEREPDRRANDEVFTTAFLNLFDMLSSWNRSVDGTLALRISGVSAPSDKWDPQKPRYRIGIEPSQGPVDAHGRRDLEHRRYEHSYLCLLRPQDLAAVTVVGSFYVDAAQGFSGRRLAPRVVPDLTAKLPNNRHASWAVCDNSRGYPALRRQLRREFAHSLVKNLSKDSGLEWLTIRSPENRFLDDRWPPPDLRDEDEGAAGHYHDPFSVAIREVTGKWNTLKHLVLSGTFDTSLFWPISQQTVVVPFWQGLTVFDVTFDMVCVSGGWYFDSLRDVGDLPDRHAPHATAMPPGYGETEEDDINAALHYSDISETARNGYIMGNYRTEPRRDALTPFISAFGRACQQMPLLKRACLVTSAPRLVEHERITRPTTDDGMWGVWFFLPGEVPPRHRNLGRILDAYDPMFFQKDVVARRRVVWDVASWSPGSELQELLGSIGQTGDDGEALQLFVDSFAAAGKAFAIEAALWRLDRIEEQQRRRNQA